MIQHQGEHQGLYGETGKEWVKYSGDYNKQFCDIKLKNGEEWGPCWPNSGIFNVHTDGSPNINESEVLEIRYYV